MNVKLILVLFFGLIAHFGQSQKDTLVQDIDTSHTVRKATILSAVLPGAGQIYNHIAQPKGKKKAYWKVPLIYTGLGAAGYGIIQLHSDALKIRTEYNYRQEFGTSTNTDYDLYDDNSLVLLESQKASGRDYSILAFILIYGLQVADAAVEAHFVHFDISPDLSMNISPWSHQNSYAGLSLSFNFR